MHMKENLINFLYDKSYFINIYEEYIHVFNYIELISLSSKKIELKFTQFRLIIDGNNLFINKMCANELLIKGQITKVGFFYE